MKILLFSSPYQYYLENLIPLSKFLKKQGHTVYASYCLKDNEEFSMLDDNKVEYSRKFLNDILKVDMVILVQSWWGRDNLIAKKCNTDGIPFYIVDHAPPIIKYTQADGTKSHLYRGNPLGPEKYFSYGPNTVKIMRDVGYKGKNIVVGSSRVEQMIANITKKKEGYVLFDTSNKMEDKKIVSKFLKFVKHNEDKQFIIREHSRSPQYFRKALQFPNVKLGNVKHEYSLFEYSDFIFSFPSSAMIVPALLDKNIYSIYDEHFCLEARRFYKQYQDCIIRLGDDKKIDVDFTSFVSDNILYNSNESTEERIYSEISKDLKRKGLI